MFIAALLISLVRYLLQPAFGTLVHSLSEKVVVSPVEENFNDSDTDVAITPRAGSFPDIALAVYAEYYSRSTSQLGASQGNFFAELRRRNKAYSETCAQDFSRAYGCTPLGNDYRYTDLTDQISGLVKTKNISIKREHNCFSNNKSLNEKAIKDVIASNSIPTANNGELSRQEINTDVVVSIPSYHNEELSRQVQSTEIIDDRMSDECSVSSEESGLLKYSSSATSGDDSDYFSAPTPADYMDSDSATSRCDVGINMKSGVGSLDSFMEIDIFEHEILDRLQTVDNRLLD